MIDNPIYQRAVAITSDYLGPAADRFIERQLAFHLSKAPAEFTKADIPRLAEWIKVSIAVLSEDHAMVNEFTKRIMHLAD